MTLLITGGTGFVMSNLARRWLEAKPGERVIVLDSAPLDGMAQRFFAPVRSRLDFIQADVTEPTSFAGLAATHRITRVVHGATITPSAVDPKQPAPRNAETVNPRRILEVNVMGTVNLLEWARQLRSLTAFVYVSSGAVYANEGPAVPGAPLPEDGFVRPDGLYSMSKHACEQLVSRYSQLFEIPATSVRLSSVYGPMDRETTSRSVKSIPFQIAHLAIAGDTIRVSSLDGVGDFIHAGDVGDALIQLVQAPRFRHPVYNIAYGEPATVRNLISYVAERLPGTRWEVVAEAEANVALNPSRRSGRWGAYDISRIGYEFAWRPRPLRQAIQDYIDWLRDNQTPAKK